MGFNPQVSLAARALFNLNAHSETVFSLLEEKGVHLMGLRCPIHPLTVKISPMVA
jgi:hypothetical protein